MLIYILPIVNAHRQIFEFSCIPSSVELVLKLLRKLPPKNFDLQKQWGNRTGSFDEFDNRIICGVHFNSQFRFERDSNFPLNDLFDCIDKELRKNRYVIVSLEEGWNESQIIYHMYVIYSKSGEGDYLAVTKKNFTQTKIIQKVKQRIVKINGTDILTYKMVS